MDTYSDLTSTVESRLARTDLSTHYAEWVELAEKDIVSRLRVREMDAAATVYVNDGIVTPPADFIGAGELRPSSNMKIAIEYVPPKVLFSYEDTTLSESRGFYSVINKALYIRPKPDGSFWGLAGSGGGSWDLADGSGSWGALSAYWLRYYARPTALTAANDTNELFPLYSDIYLYMTLSQAFAHVREWEKSDRYRMRGMELIDQHNDRWLLEREGEGALQVMAPIVA